VPGLIDPVPYLEQIPVQELPALPSFSTMLSRGKRSIPDSPDYGFNSFYTCLLKEFELRNLLKPLPIASICYLNDIENASDLNDKYLMRADPCFMAPDRDQLVLAQIKNLNISLPEARQFVDEINEFFNGYEEESFWTLKAITPEHWYIVSDKAINIAAIPPEKVVGQSVKSFLSNGKLLSGKNSGHWLNLFNEFQMVLHNSPTNKQRVEQGKLPVNSLWFWGAGQAVNISKVTNNTTTVYADNNFAKGLANLKGYRLQGIAESYQFAGNEDEQIIYIMDDFIRAIQNRDIFTWVGLLKQFEDQYLIPLVQELNSGKVSQVEFVSPTGTRLMVTKKQLNRWWRKKLPFYNILKNLP